jgi:hypothetical protein
MQEGIHRTVDLLKSPDAQDSPEDFNVSPGGILAPAKKNRTARSPKRAARHAEASPRYSIFRCVTVPCASGKEAPRSYMCTKQLPCQTSPRRTARSIRGGFMCNCMWNKTVTYRERATCARSLYLHPTEKRWRSRICVYGKRSESDPHNSRASQGHCLRSDTLP